MNHAGRPQRRSRWPNPDQGEQPESCGWRFMSVPITTNSRYHNVMQEVKWNDVKTPTFLVEVRLVFRNSSPWELTLPHGQPQHGAPRKTFSRNVKWSRTEQTEGCANSWSHGRERSGLLSHKWDTGATRSVPRARDYFPFGSSFWGICWGTEGCFLVPPEGLQPSLTGEKPQGFHRGVCRTHWFGSYSVPAVAMKYKLIHYDSLSVYTHLDEKKRKKYSRRRKKRW